MAYKCEFYFLIYMTVSVECFNIKLYILYIKIALICQKLYTNVITLSQRIN